MTLNMQPKAQMSKTIRHRLIMARLDAISAERLTLENQDVILDEVYAIVRAIDWSGWPKTRKEIAMLTEDQRAVLLGRLPLTQAGA